MHYGELAGNERVGILFTDAACGSPAGMTNAGSRSWRFKTRSRFVTGSRSGAEADGFGGAERREDFSTTGNCLGILEVIFTGIPYSAYFLEEIQVFFIMESQAPGIIAAVFHLLQAIQQK